MTDKDFENLVKRVAKGEASTAEYEMSVGYLWRTPEQYRRLAETPAGLFLREKASPCPDLTLRAMYRKKLLGASND